MLSVRCAAVFPNPTRGLMQTILNVGINDDIVEEICSATNDGKVGWECYYRFVRQFGIIFSHFILLLSAS